MLTASCIIICRNEERCIKRCLSSLEGLFDEVLIVDTGSTDNTLNIIDKSSQFINIKTIHKSWNNNFSAIRNFALKNSKHDVVMFMDADELIIESQKISIINMINNVNNNENICYRLRIFNLGINNTDVTLERIYNKRGVQFQGRVHEQPLLPEHIIIKTLDEIVLEHDGYEHDNFETKDKARRNFTLAKMDFYENESVFRLMYYLHDLKKLSDDEIKNESIDINTIEKIITNNSKSKHFENCCYFLLHILILKEINISQLFYRKPKLKALILRYILTDFSVCILVNKYNQNLSDTLNDISNIVSDIRLLDSSKDNQVRNIFSSIKNVKIHKFNWNDNFSNARNKITQLASNKIVLHIDSDEKPLNSNEIVDLQIRFKHNKLRKIGLVKIKDTNNENFYSVPRLLNKDLHEFKGYCHEELVIKAHNSIIYNDENCYQLNLNLIHSGYNDEKEFSLKMVRNINYLENYLQQHPIEKFNLRWVFFLVRENYNIKNYSNALKIIDSSLKETSVYYNTNYLNPILSYAVRLKLITQNSFDYKIASLMNSDTFENKYYNLVVNTRKSMFMIKEEIYHILNNKSNYLTNFEDERVLLNIFFENIKNMFTEIYNHSIKDNKK